MEIVALLGSPRASGNSAFIAERFLEAARKKGARTTVFALNKLRYRGCQACDACKTRLDHCGLKDDLSPVLDAVMRADAVLLASPIYYGDLTAQMKGFVDRTFCYFTPEFRTNGHQSRLPSGKKLVMVLTQAAPSEHFADVFRRYSRFLSYHGFTEAHLIRGCDLVGPEDVRQKTAVLKLAEKTAAAVARQGRGPKGP
jgi:multimeric flavodoxin WrbA